MRFLRGRCSVVLIVAAGAIVWSGCSKSAPPVKPAPASSAVRQPDAKIRNVILVIGDGMGPQQLGMLFAYAHLAPGSKVPERTPVLETMARKGNIALVRTEPSGTIVVDSAAAATQLATGEYSGSEMIGLNQLGEHVPTVLEIARDLGKATGLVSDTRITHATPAGFAAHQRERNMENEIACDMLDNRVDVLLSGGLRHFVPKEVNDPNSATHMAVVQMIGGQFQPTSKRDDSRNLLVESRQDYQLVFDHQSLAKVKDGRVLGLFADSEMLDALAENEALQSASRTQPTLVEMTQKAIEILSQDPNGFFLMVEGGQIDWCGHNNDAGCMLHELLQLDDAVRYVYNWAKDRDDTVVLVTADHETGSFGFSYSGVGIPDPTTLPGEPFKDVPFAPNFDYAAPETLDRLYGQKHSFYHIFSTFDALPEEEKTPERLMTLVNEAVAPLSITLEQAAELLTRTANRFYVEGHPYLGTPTLPKMPDQEAFFVYGENLRMNRLGHFLGEQQRVVWGTGTHTSTPVALIAFGPPQAIARFTGFIHSTDIGKGMIALVKGE